MDLPRGNFAPNVLRSTPCCTRTKYDTLPYYVVHDFIGLLRMRDFDSSQVTLDSIFEVPGYISEQSQATLHWGEFKETQSSVWHKQPYEMSKNWPASIFYRIGIQYRRDGRSRVHNSEARLFLGIEGVLRQYTCISTLLPHTSLPANNGDVLSSQHTCHACPRLPK